MNQMTNTMPFYAALAAMINGASVQRTGWHGTGMELRAQIPDANSKMTLPYIYMQYPENHEVYPGARVPWLCSVTDFLADDYIQTSPTVSPVVELPVVADVINGLRAGKALTREGWNGKKMYLQLAPATGTTDRHILLTLPNGRKVPWVPSQTDIFARDWMFKEDVEKETYGMRMVGYKFNPSMNPEVDQCKASIAAEIDRINDVMEKRFQGRDLMISEKEADWLEESAVMAGAAVEKLMTAQMWAVKVLTFSGPEGAK